MVICGNCKKEYSATSLKCPHCSQTKTLVDKALELI